MDPVIYQEMIEHEEIHWWYTSRRSIIKSMLDRLRLPASAVIMEAGCGSGGNLSMLSHYGDLFAFELDDTVRAHARERHIGNVAAGKLPGDIPFAGQNFDLIACFDVLEHVEDDKAALRALAERLNAGGAVAITVPAFQFLSSYHDKLNHHFRRYSRQRLMETARSAELTVEFISYWNFFLFPMAVLVRLLGRIGLMKDHNPGAAIPALRVNGFLNRLVASERHIMKYVRLPAGLSIIAVLRKA